MTTIYSKAGTDAAIDAATGALTPEDVGADPAGTAAGAVAAHTGATNPHPEYLTPAELPATYAPSAHAGSHATGQPDALTPASIGAATAAQGALADATTVQQVTLAAPLAYTLPVGVPAGVVHRVTFTQDATGGHTVTYDDQPVAVDLTAGASTLVEVWPGEAPVIIGAAGAGSGVSTDAGNLLTIGTDSLPMLDPSTLPSPESLSALGSLSDVNTIGAVVGQSLVFNGATWGPASVSGASSGPTKPYIVEVMSTFNQYGSTSVPSGTANYAGGQAFWGITGTQGDSFVTVTSGTFADAGGSWSAVIKDNAGNWKPYLVTGNDGVDKLNISPPLAVTITSGGEIGNLHDAHLGQHYTIRGYKALAQHVFNANPKYADRNKHAGKFKGTDTTGLTIIGTGSVYYAEGLNTGSSPLKNHSTAAGTANVQVGVGAAKGLKKTFTVTGHSGFMEFRLGSGVPNTETIVEFWKDGVMTRQITGLGTKAEYILEDFTGINTIEFRAYATNASKAFTIRVQDVTCWVNETVNPATMFPPGSSIVYLGDSWGVFPIGSPAGTSAMTDELRRLLFAANGYPARVINHSLGGMTTKWGEAWFHDYVVKEAPSHVILEFFVNDSNSNGIATGGAQPGPHGDSIDTIITSMAEWRTRMRNLCAMALAYGIQPVVIGPAMVATASQSQNLANWNVYLTEGTAI